MKITRCTGEGQGECKRCKELKGWGLNWTSFLYTIEGHTGRYCMDCVKAIIAEEETADGTENSH